MVKKKAVKKKIRGARPPARNIKRKKVVKKPIVRKKIRSGTTSLRNKLDDRGRVSTGVSRFDSMVQGGFEKNSTNLLIGGSGAGKTIFATQFLMRGLENGEKCLYITFEEKKDQFFSNMKEFGWDLADYEKKGLFIFLEYSPIKVKTMLEEGGGSIESIILKEKTQRIVIDSITSFALLFEDELSKREAALSLFAMIHAWKATALLTVEEEPSISGKVSSSKTLEFESDSLIAMYFFRKKTKRERYIEVLKMRGTKHSKEVFPFSLETNGVVISSRAASGF